MKRELQIFPHKVKGRVSETAFGINSKTQRKHKLWNKRISEPIFTNLCAPPLNGWLSESFSESTQINSCPWQQVFFFILLGGLVLFSPRKWFFKQKMSLKDVKNDRAHSLSQAGTALRKASWEVAQVLLVSDDGVAFVPVNLGGNWGGVWWSPVK